MNDANSRCILAVDAGGTFLKAALFSIDYSIHSCTLIKDTFFKISVNSDGDLPNIKNSYIKVTSLGAKEASKRGLELDGIGVCIPGPFDYKSGTCLMKHKYMSIYGVSMLPWIKEAVGEMPIHFVHDSTAFIIGATNSERFNHFKKIGAVIIGTGLGFATLSDSKVFINSQGGPGISIFSRPYRSSIAEDYVSRRSIISQFRKLYPSSIDDVVDIVSLARSGNTAAIKIFNDLGIYLSEIIHDIIKDNKYECLLLGGAISKSADLFITSLKQGLCDIPTLITVESAEDIDNAPLLGAAKAML